MDAEAAANIERLLGFLSWGIRFLGLLGFGLTSGWLTMHAYSNSGKAWQVQAASVVAFLYLAGVMVNSGHPAAAGAYTIGASIAVFIWGISKNKSAPSE
ncbi:MAG: hypothetical protein N2C13_00230 [Chloroflexota bacterium]